MAATLIHIKSKTLLPVHEVEEEAEEGELEDPRQELVARLLEYQKFKEAAGELESRESIWRQIFSRTPAECSSDLAEEVQTAEMTPFDLLDALQKIIARLPDPAGLVINNDDLSVRDQISFILSKIERSSSLLFEQLFEGIETRYAVVVTFLALLEIVRLGLIRIVQTEICSPIRLVATDNLLEGEHGRS
jgi:segregation and condensation protein A